jgi:hypothetical protein
MTLRYHHEEPWVEGFRFRISVFGYRDENIGFRVEGFGFRV